MVMMMCPKCGHALTRKVPGHFVGPCFGDAGFFACKEFCDECRVIAGLPLVAEVKPGR